jgi:hypothetical protein
MRDYTHGDALDPFIEVAGMLVDDVVACAAEDEITLSDAKLELLERWLAAHAYKQSDRGYSEKQTGRARAKYEGKTGMYLTSTRYGQIAISLDTSGCLAAIAEGGGTSAGGFWLGKSEPDQLNYRERN